MMDNNIAIKVDNLSKAYKLYDKPIHRLKEAMNPFKKKYHNDFYALNDISFKIKKGETVGIIGKNGSGKSTLLKIITGILSPSSGSVQVNGKVSALLELGAGFNPELTGMENIHLNGIMMGYSHQEMEKHVPDILKFADIGDFIHQPVKTYSSGMFVRLAFAVAINIEPDLLIIDEALSVGDVFFQNKCFKRLEEIRNLGTTILFVSHDLSSIRLMCEKVLWLDNGIQKEYGNAQEICSEYFNVQMEEKNLQNENLVNQLEAEKHISSSQKTKQTFPILNQNKIVANGKDLFSEDAKIVSFFISDKNNKITTDLLINQEYSFHIITEFKADIREAILGFVFENNKGIPLLTMNTFMYEYKTIECFSGEIVEAVFKIRLPKIARGEYLISPAIAEGEQENHVMKTWLHNTLKVQIINDGLSMSLLELEPYIQINKYKPEDVSLF